MQASGTFLYFSELAREKMQELPVLEGLRLVLVGNADKANLLNAVNAGTLCHCDSGNSNTFRRVSSPWSQGTTAGVRSRHEC